MKVVNFMNFQKYYILLNISANVLLFLDFIG